MLLIETLIAAIKYVYRSNLKPGKRGTPPHLFGSTPNPGNS